MVGRDGELEQILGLLGNAIAGEGSLALISGEAGIGKTRVLEASISLAEKCGYGYVIGRCVSGAPSPYLPFFEAFSAFPDDPFTEHVGSEERTAKGSTSVVLIRVIDFLTDRSQNGPFLVCLEDLQWADSVTLQLLHFIASKVSGLRVLVIGTYRPEDISKDVGEGPHPLRSTIQDMVREGTVREVLLDRIGEDALTRALKGMLGGAVDEELSRRVVTESGGNPLFLVEIVRMLASSGLIEEKNDVWKFIEKGVVTIPVTVREVIARRLERLPREQRRALECASVIGEHFDSKIIEQVLGEGRMQLLEELESMERSHLVRSEEDGFCFDHEMIREVAYDRISNPRRRELHRGVGKVIEAGMPDKRLLAILSKHFYRSGQTDECVEYSVQAGDYFLNESCGESIQYYERALDLLGAGAGSEGLRLRALIGLGDAHYFRVDILSADKAYQEAQSLASGTPDEARLLWRRAECHFPQYLGNGDRSVARELLEKAVTLTGLDDFDLGSIFSLKAELLIFDGRNEEAERNYCRAEEALSRTTRVERLMEVMNDRSELLSVLKRGDESIVKKNEALALLKDHQSPLMELKIKLGLAELYITVGEEQSALEHLKAVETVADRSGNYAWLMLVNSDRELLKELKGDHIGAVIQAREALRHSERKEWLNYAKAKTCAVLALMNIMVDDIDGAETLMTRVRQLTVDFKWEVNTPTRGRIVLAEALLAGSRGRAAEYHTLSEEAMEIFATGWRDVFSEALAAQTLGFFSIKIGEAERGKELLMKAKRLFLELGNGRQGERLDTWISLIE